MYQLVLVLNPSLAAVSRGDDELRLLDSSGAVGPLHYVNLHI
jgi:hypothetical protein